MSEDQNGQQQPEPARDTAEVTAIKASHRQEIAKLEMDREQSIARLDAQMFENMPISLRILFDERLYRRVTAVAETMARADGVTPRHLIGKQEACVAVVSKSITWNLDPFSVAQSTYQTPDGKIGFEGRLVQSIMEASRRLSRPIGQGEYFGDWSKIEGKFKIVKGQTSSGKSYDKPEPTWTYWGQEEEGVGVRYKVYLHGQAEPIPFEFMLRSAFPRNAITWPTRTKQQLHYAAMRALGSVVCPSLIMGVPFQGDEHFADVQHEMRDVTPPAAPAPVDLAAEGIKGGGETGTTPQTANAAPAGDRQPSDQQGASQQASKGGGKRTNAEIQSDIIAELQNASSTGEVTTILDANRRFKLNEKIWAEIELEADAARDRIAGQDQGDAFATLQGQAMATAEDAGRTLIKLVIACQAEGELEPFEDPESEVGAVVARLPDELRQRVARNVSGRRQQIIDMAEEQPSERGMARPDDDGGDDDGGPDMFPQAA